MTAACLALAGLRPTASVWALARPVCAALAVLTVAHIADVAALTHDCDRQYAEIREAFAALPRGAEVMTVVERNEPKPGTACTNLPIYEHLAQLVTIDRSGYSRDFFARLKSVAVRGDRPTDTDPTAADSFAVAPPSGYVLRIHFGWRRPIPPGLTLLRQGSFFDLWSAG